MELNENIKSIKGIGEKSEKLFNKLGIYTVEELLYFYPREYDIFGRIEPIANASEGKKMKLTWNSSLVEIDPLFLKTIGNNGGNSGSLELTMNDTNSSYLIQFYRLPGGSISKWGDLGLTFGLAP